jgi:hypothetical protein
MPPTTSEIRIIGARNSGKTTYLATLAFCPEGLKEKYKGLAIESRNDEAEQLSNLAKDLLLKGQKFGGDPFDSTQLHKLRYYDFLITISKDIKIELTARDFPGEFFQDIPLTHKWQEIKDWVNDLFTTTGWLVMITDWEPEWDTSLYKPAFSKLYQEIAERERVNPAIKNLRIAVVMAKCERGELWPCRLDPDEDLFEVRLPETYQFLTQKFSPQKLQFFACSAFGVMCDRPTEFDPRPNCYLPDDGSSEEITAFLKDATNWYPYGLIPPLYWLATGIRLEE